MAGRTVSSFPSVAHHRSMGSDLPSSWFSLPVVVIVLASCLYIAVSLTWGRFANLDNDEIFYKAPGREWAATGHFRSPELKGYLGVVPPLEEIWLIYPPTYPFVFGLVVKVVGFGWRQCVGFDAVVHVIVSWLTVLIVGRFTGSVRTWPAVLCFLSVLVLGVLGRPDDLATAFGLIGILFVLRPYEQSRRALTYSEIISSGLSFGLCGATSPVAGIVLGAIGCPYIVERSGSTARAVVLLTCWTATAAFIFMLTIMPILVVSPTAYQQFIAQSRLVTGLDTRTVLERLTIVLTIGRRLSVPILGTIVLALLSFPSELKQKKLSRWSHHWLGIFLAIGALLLIRIHNYSYLWYVLPFALASFFASFVQGSLFGNRRLDVLGAGFLLATVGFGASQFFRETLILASLPQEQTLDYNADLVRREIPLGSTIVAYDLWWSLGNDYRVFEHQVPEKHWSEVQAVVSTTGSPMGQDQTRPSPRDQYLASHFESALDARNPEPIRLMGAPLSRTFRGYGVHILRRTDGDFTRNSDH